ncbi:MAG: dipeptidase [Pseudomonadota bacterium]
MSPLDLPATPVFDGHNDTLLKLEIAERKGFELDFATGAPEIDIDLPRAREAGFAGGLWAMYTPSRVAEIDRPYDRRDPRNFGSVERATALDFTLAMFARLRRLARALPLDLAICSDVADVRRAMASGQIAVWPHIEGAECIDTDFHALEVLHAAGLRSLGPVWSRPNVFGHGAPMVRRPEIEPGEGLTEAGRALVQACEALGIVVDCAHLTEQGFWDVAEVSERPLIVSHSNAHALSPNARNLSDRQLAAVAERQGLVGLNFHVCFLREDCALDRDTPLTQMIRHLDHLIEHVGEDGVALGSDFDGCELPREIGDVTGLPRLVAAMRQAGYGEALVEKLCWRNWLCALERATA